ncbi:5035_t:CDS:2, partial [Ambispora leptoticha]
MARHNHVIAFFMITLESIFKPIENNYQRTASNLPKKITKAQLKAHQKRLPENSSKLAKGNNQRTAQSPMKKIIREQLQIQIAPNQEENYQRTAPNPAKKLPEKAPNLAKKLPKNSSKSGKENYQRTVPNLRTAPNPVKKITKEQLQI